MEVNIKIIAVLAHFAFLLVYGLLVWALLLHYKKYSLPKDRARWIWGIFIFFAVIFALTATILLFAVPWDEIISQ